MITRRKLNICFNYYYSQAQARPRLCGSKPKTKGKTFKVQGQRQGQHNLQWFLIETSWDQDISLEDYVYPCIINREIYLNYAFIRYACVSHTVAHVSCTDQANITYLTHTYYKLNTYLSCTHRVFIMYLSHTYHVLIEYLLCTYYYLYLSCTC